MGKAELDRLLEAVEVEFCDCPQSFDEVFDVLLAMRDLLRQLVRKEHGADVAGDVARMRAVYERSGTP